MAKRHNAGPTLLAQLRRCQELMLARAGVDEFYETIRLLVAKSFHERSGNIHTLNFETAQRTLLANASVVERFVDGEVGFTAPQDVIDECFRVLSLTRLDTVGYETLDAAFEAMTSRESKSEKGQFFTPRHVVKFCIDVLRPKPTDLICDPACGSGAFLKAAFDYQGKSAIPDTLFGFDISRRASRTAKVMSFLACQDQLKIAQVDSLSLGSSTLFGLDGSTIEEHMKKYSNSFSGFDVIATNPPFAGDVGTSDYASQYELGNAASCRIERDVLFLERCIRLLRPGGRLAIVLPDNKVSGNKFAPVRKWLLSEANVTGVVSLHSYTFRPYTSQKAVVVFAQKYLDKRDKPSGVNMYRSDKAGKTSSGELVIRDGEIDHDLDLISHDMVQAWKI